MATRTEQEFMNRCIVFYIDGNKNRVMLPVLASHKNCEYNTVEILVADPTIKQTGEIPA